MLGWAVNLLRNLFSLLRTPALTFSHTRIHWLRARCGVKGNEQIQVSGEKGALPASVFRGREGLDVVGLWRPGWGRKLERVQQGRLHWKWSCPHLLCNLLDFPGEHLLQGGCLEFRVHKYSGKKKFEAERGRDKEERAKKERQKGREKERKQRTNKDIDRQTKKQTDKQANRCLKSALTFAFGCLI